jgi:PAS domain S-box-containing protein
MSSTLSPGQPTWEELAAQLDQLSKTSGEAEALLESLAAAILPAENRDISRLTWSELQPSENETPDDVHERLRRLEARFKTLVEQIPAVTFMAVLGEGKNEIYVSPHVEQMLGFTQAEWLADPFLWFWQLHPDDRARWNDEFARGIRTGGPFRAECRFYARDGRVVWVHGEARIAKDDRGRPMFLQGVAFDITESKRAQEILLKDAVKSAKIEEELAIARRVQTSILPKTFDIEGLEIAAMMVPATEVGGDYYDCLRTPDGGWFAIGDVSGHGLNAGLVMLMVQSATIAVVRGDPTSSPKQVLIQLNELLYDNVRSRLEQKEHVTFTLFRYLRDGRLTFAGAHEDILVWRKRTKKVELFRPPGTWLAARRDISRVTIDTSIQLEDGDVMVLYTDGVTEAMNAKGEQFNIDRLWDFIEQNGEKSPNELCTAIFEAILAWMHVQHDDISIMVLRYTKP